METNEIFPHATGLDFFNACTIFAKLRGKNFHGIMFKKVCILMATLGLLAGGAVSAQTITNSGYSTVAHIKSDGTIQDGSYRTIGHIKSDGTVQDGSYRTIGHIKSDGTVQDGSYRTVGHIKSDGTVQDGSYRTIGHIKSDGTVQDGSYRTIGHASGIPMKWAAMYFFFM